ncbi:PBP superfamily domain protein [compost metagenome]
MPRGNPRGLRGIPDLLQPGLRYVNRALGTGTRVLFDELLEEAGIDAQAIDGYQRTEPSHKAVAHAVASGSADAGLGIASAAVRERLDFVPLVKENYFLVCLKSTLDQPSTLALMEILRSATWQALLARMPGYTPTDSGEVLSLRRMLPWWDFGGKPKRRAAGVKLGKAPRS